jgi:hypothetical protein
MRGTSLFQFFGLRYQLDPWNYPVHLIEEDLLAGSLGQLVKVESALIHAQHRPSPSRHPPVGVTRGFADLSLGRTRFSLKHCKRHQGKHGLITLCPLTEWDGMLA